MTRTQISSVLSAAVLSVALTVGANAQTQTDPAQSFIASFSTPGTPAAPSSIVATDDVAQSFIAGLAGERTPAQAVNQVATDNPAQAFIARLSTSQSDSVDATQLAAR